jgi:hypothetical protein
MPDDTPDILEDRQEPPDNHQAIYVFLDEYWGKAPVEKDAEINAKLDRQNARDRLCRFFAEARYAFWQAEMVHPLLESITGTQVAELFHVTPGQASRILDSRHLTAEQFYTLLESNNIAQIKLLDPGIGVLAGMTGALPQMANLNRTQAGKLPHQSGLEPLQIVDTALLCALLQSSRSVDKWTAATAHFAGNLARGLSDPSLRCLLDSCLDRAVSLLLPCPAAALLIQKYSTKLGDYRPLCQKLAALWNCYQIDWVCTVEAVQDYFPVPEWRYSSTRGGNTQ